MGTCF